MEDGLLAINYCEEDLGSLIRTSIDIDGWISGQVTQLEGHESGLIHDQDSSISLQPDEDEIAEGTCSSEFCGLEKCGKSVSSFQPEDNSPSAAGELESYVFGGLNGVQEPQQPKLYLVPRTAEAGEQPSQEEFGGCVTLEKTPEQRRCEDLMNLQRQGRNFHATNSVSVQNSASSIEHRNIFKNLPSFQDTFRTFSNNPYLQGENQCPVTTARQIMKCYKCRGVIEPRDWIRSITAAGTGFAAVYHADCFYCDYCKGVLCTDQYYTFHQRKLICNFDFQMLTNLRKVTDHKQKRLVVLHTVKKDANKIVKISIEQNKILQQALRSKNRTTNPNRNP